MSALTATKGSDSPKSRDDTARYPSAVALHDEQFAESAVHEYLITPSHLRPFAGSGSQHGSWRPDAGALVGRGRFGLGRRGRPGLPRGPLLGVVAGGIAPFFVRCRSIDASFRLRSCGACGVGGAAIASICTWRSAGRNRRFGRSSCAGANGRRQRA